MQYHHLLVTDHIHHLMIVMMSLHWKTVSTTVVRTCTMNCFWCNWPVKDVKPVEPVKPIKPVKPEQPVEPVQPHIDDVGMQPTHPTTPSSFPPMIFAFRLQNDWNTLIQQSVAVIEQLCKISLRWSQKA